MSRFTFSDLENGISASLGSELNSRFDALRDVADLTIAYKGAWSAIVSYYQYDAVTSGGSWWVSLINNNVNVTPVEGASWTQLGSATTTEGIQDAVGGILVDTSTVDLTYNDGTPSITAAVVGSSLGDTQFANQVIDDTAAPASDTGKPGVLLDNLANRIKAATGEAGWKDAPDTTLALAAVHLAAAAPHSGHLNTDGSNAMAADFDAGGFKLTNLADGVDPTDAATVSQMDAVASGYVDLENAKAMATTNTTLSGAQTIDGVSCVADERVFLSGQTTLSQNGPWLVKAGAWDRPLDYDTGDTPVAGTRIFVTYGTNHAGQSWTLLTSGAVIDTDPTAWTQTGAGGGGEINTASNGNSEGVGVYDSKSGVDLVMRGIASTNSFITVALNAGTKSIRLTLNEALLTLNNLLGTLLATKGGTGQSTYAIGDTLYASAANVLSKLTGNTAAAAKYYRQTGDGADSAPPEWVEIEAVDLPVAQPSGAGHASGAVPDTPATPGITLYLCEDMTYRNPAIVAGAGDMVGPGSAVDGDLAGFDGTTGKLLKVLSGISAAKITSGALALARGGTNADLSASGGAVNTTGKQVLRQGADNVIGAAALIAADLPNTAVTPGSYTATDLTVDAQGRITAAANGAGGSGAVTQIAQTVLGSAAASITFSSISGSYSDLLVTFVGRGTAVATAINLLARLNGDTGSNYDIELVGGNLTTPVAGEGIAATSMNIANITAASAVANAPGVVRILIPAYARTTFLKAAIVESGYKASGSSGGITTYRTIGFWRSTAAVTSITIFGSSGNLDTGCVATLWGIT